MTGPPGLRASDADRERAVGQLREHSLAGRLTVEELDERSAAAFAATTVGELDALLADLPPAQHAGGGARRRRRRADPGGIGRRQFTYVFEHPVRPAKAMDSGARARWRPARGRGYELVDRDERRLVFDYAYRPGLGRDPVHPGPRSRACSAC